MSLTDLMSAAGLESYPQVALIAFIIAFAIIVVRLFSPRNRERYERARNLPLEDQEPNGNTSGRNAP
jgi:cbb3-type cytochrome oxidase subunit 3